MSSGSTIRIYRVTSNKKWFVSLSHQTLTHHYINDRVPAKIDLRVKSKIFRTANCVKVVISAIADFPTQRLILFFWQAAKRLLVQ